MIVKLLRWPSAEGDRPLVRDLLAVRSGVDGGADWRRGAAERRSGGARRDNRAANEVFLALVKTSYCIPGAVRAGASWCEPGLARPRQGSDYSPLQLAVEPGQPAMCGLGATAAAGRRPFEEI